MKANKISLFDSNAYDFEELKKDIMENNDMTENDIDDNYVYDVMHDYLDDDWNMLLDMLKQVDNYGWVLAGNVRTWNGTRYGLRYVDSLVNELPDLGDSFEIWLENGHLHINAYHHDGGCFIEAKPVSYNGKVFYDNWNYGYSEKSEYDILDTMFRLNFYTNLPKNLTM